MTLREVRLSVVIVAALLTQICSAQRVLSEAQSITASTNRPIEAPPFNYFGDSQCDGDGNLYFHSGSFRSAQIFQLSRDGSTGKFLQPTGKFAEPDAAEFDSFWVSERRRVINPRARRWSFLRYPVRPRRHDEGSAHPPSS